MRVPMRVDYGVRALVELAFHYGEAPVQTSFIAEKQNIPEPYLDQLLTAMNKMGFIRSKRGPGGGHVLAQNPQDITLERVMDSIDGNSATIDCITEPGVCLLSSHCAQRDIWRSVGEAIQGVLSSITVADLAEREKQGLTPVTNKHDK